jgi:ribosomal subunit interface protein
MRIAVSSENITLDEQTRAYTEYRVFSSLAPFARHIDHVEVVLSEHPADSNGDETACNVTVDLTPKGRVGVRSCALRAYSAIDRAASKIEEVMNRRASRRLSS